MASRTFENSDGFLWEVFEVRRESEAPRGVSAGLEKGWLSFVSGGSRRRLAPFPENWSTMTDTELERLCAAARVATSAQVLRARSGGAKDHSVAEESVVAKASSAVTDISAGKKPEKQSRVRDTVRLFAHEARVSRLPAIEAMVRLKSILADTYGGGQVDESSRAEAADLRLVRRWFVDAFYFDRQM
ncbi:MAG: hypothetical protein ABI969_12760 [bacterium]